MYKCANCGMQERFSGRSWLISCHAISRHEEDSKTAVTIDGLLFRHFCTPGLHLHLS